MREAAAAEQPNGDMLWKQYELFTGLFKHYLKLVIEVNALYYAVTGGIVSFYFARASTNPQMRWALVLPFAMSIGLAVVFAWGATLSRNVQGELSRIAGDLGLGIYPAAQVLTALLCVFAVLFFLVAAGLVLVFFGALNASG